MSTFIVNAKRSRYLRINNPFKKKRMMKYPIGIQSFDQIIEGNWVYVDKMCIRDRSNGHNPLSGD